MNIAFFRVNKRVNSQKETKEEICTLIRHTKRMGEILSLRIFKCGRGGGLAGKASATHA